MGRHFQRKGHMGTCIPVAGISMKTIGFTTEIPGKKHVEVRRWTTLDCLGTRRNQVASACHCPYFIQINLGKSRGLYQADYNQ